MTDAADRRLSVFEVVIDACNEIVRQERLVAEGRFRYAMSDPETPAEHRIAVLIEEVGEVAKAVLQGAPGVYEELVQVAACVLAWAANHQRPEPEEQSKCGCGHGRAEHWRGSGNCMHATREETWACDCHEFVPIGLAPQESS